MKFLKTLAALLVAISAAAPPVFAVDPSGDTGSQASSSGQSIGSFPGTIPEQRVAGNFRSPNMTILGGTLNVNKVRSLTQWSNIPSLVLRPSGTSGSSLDTTIIWTTPAAARTYTIPDAGANASFLLSAGSVSPTFPTTGIILAGTSFNGTVKEIATLGQATTYTIPDSSASTDTFATLKAANTFTGVNTFPTGGIVLKGTSFDDTLKALAANGQATTVTIPDAGSATANVLLDKGVTSAVTMQHVAVPISSANLLAMYAAPVQLIAAGAAGTNIVVHKVMFTMASTATQYASGGVVGFQLSNTANGAGTATTATVAAAVVNAAAGTSYTTVIPVSYTGTAATGLYISNQTGAFTTGTGTAIVDIWYSIK